MKAILLLALFTLTLCSYKSGGSIYAGTFATCGECTQEENLNCSTPCITFRDNDGSTKDINEYQFLAEECWEIESCAHFPKFYAFQTDTECESECEVNIFPGFSKTELNNIDGLYNAKGYNMMCIEYAYKGTAFPDICQLAEKYAVIF